MRSILAPVELDTVTCPVQSEELDHICRVGVQAIATGQQWRNPLGHRHALYLLMQGRGRFSSEGQQHDLQPGCLIARTANLAFSFEAESRLLLRMIAFRGRRLGQLLEQTLGGRHLVCQPRGAHRFQPLLEDLHQLLTADMPYAHEIALSQLEALIWRLRAVLVSDQGRVGQAEQRYIDSRRYASQHFRRLAAVQDWAAACHCDPAHLCRLWRRFAGQAPAQFLLGLKMAEAEHLLEQSDLSIRAIGAAVGIDDPTRFSKIFKRIIGRSPRDSRRGAL